MLFCFRAQFGRHNDMVQNKKTSVSHGMISGSMTDIRMFMPYGRCTGEKCASTDIRYAGFVYCQKMTPVRKRINMDS